MSDIIKKDPTGIDNFAGWEDGVEGDDRPQGAGIIQGSLVKFTNEAMWVTRDGDELPADLELVAVDVGRVVQKWWDGQPVETIILEPHQKFPDIDEMNEKVPKKEWVEGPDGNMRGPWQAQHILYLLDPKTMDKFTFPTGTVGGRIGIRELVDKTTWMRRLRSRAALRHIHEHEVGRQTAPAFQDRALGQSWQRRRSSRGVAAANVKGAAARFVRQRAGATVAVRLAIDQGTVARRR